MYSETHSWELTSGSTPYSGARRLDNNDSSNNCRRARCAIEWHTCSLDFGPEEDDKPAFTWREITEHEEDSLVCVGYSAVGQWECLALLDASKLAVPQPTTTQQSQSNPHHETTTDDHSVSTTTIASSSRASFDTASDSRARAVPTSLLDSSSVHGGTPTETASAQPEIFRPEGPISLLILRKLALDNEGMEYTTEEFTTILDFRPLAPTLCQLSLVVANNISSTTNSSEEELLSTGIWLGSSDNIKLHWFEADPESKSLKPRFVDNNEPAFQFSSPVMAIDFQAIIREEGEKRRNCLAVACQDGTIRTITFGYQDGVFVDVRHSQVIVDGPIVCIDVLLLRREDRPWKLQVVAGSLCGYATELFVDPNTCDSEGPYMVAEGFWNATIEAEDSVLAIRASEGNTVLVGTHSGKLLVYGLHASSTSPTINSDDTREYRLLWQCQLPYSIHGLCCLEGSAEILVTTRRSLHVFQKSRSFIDHKHRAALIKANLIRYIEAVRENGQKAKVQQPTEESEIKVASEEEAVEEKEAMTREETPTVPT